MAVFTHITKDDLKEFLQNYNINNYLLPLNYILLASHFERENFISMGYETQKLKVIGWLNNENLNKKINHITFSEILDKLEIN